MNPTTTSATTVRLTSAYLMAERRLSDIIAQWAGEWPAAPEAITIPLHVSDGDLERGLSGAVVEPLRNILASDHFHREIRRSRLAAERAARKGKPVEVWHKHREDMEAAARDAGTYEAECARVRALSGVEVAREERNGARRELLAHVASLMRCEPANKAELDAQAHALQSVAFLPPHVRAADEIAGQWLARFAASVICVNAEGGAA